mmetsp:Transcript_31611/g.103028  ORF Transcript_31611/g.103028 Transcript_31611/m.103028 type:complete len:394 (-) Transcript_31611:788-1969(-)
MEPPNVEAVRDGEARDARRLDLLVELNLARGVDRGRALVEDGKLRLVEEDAREAHALALTAAQNLVPFRVDVVQAVVEVDEHLPEASLLQTLHNLRVRARVALHLQRVRHLVAKRTPHKVRSLREKVHLFRVDGDLSVRGRPEACEHAEEARLAASVRAGDDDGAAGGNLEVEVLDEHALLRFGGNRDCDVAEDDAIGRGGLLLRRLRRLLSFERVEELRDAVRESRELLQVLAEHEHFGKGGAALEHNLLRGSERGDALPGFELGSSEEGEVHEDAADEQALKLGDVVRDARLNACEGVFCFRVDERAEVGVEVGFFGARPAQERHLLCVRDEARVRRTKIALERLLLGHHAPERGRHPLERNRDDNLPRKQRDWARKPELGGRLHEREHKL